MPMLFLALIAALVLFAPPGLAQQATPAPAEQATPVPAAVATPEPAADSFLKVYFGSGSSRIESDQIATLDLAARTYREGNPFVMVVAGGADTVGNASANLELSLARATAVADALVARGIPVDRLQVLGRGNSELDVPTAPDTPEPQNRVVEISWR